MCGYPGGSSSEACNYVYTRQPPSHLSCTPHRSLVLLCEAHSNWQAFRLLWYAVPPHTDSPIQLPSLLPNITVKMMPVAGHSHHVISTLSLPLSLLYRLRQIYCQIELHNESLLQPSQVMVLEKPPLAKPELCTQKSLLAAQEVSKCAYLNPSGHGRVAKQLEPQRSTMSTEMPARPPAALYAIVAVIVLFVIVIISLTIIVVLLYRKKCVQMEISSPGE